MFGNMKEILKQAQNMKSQMKKIKKELKRINNILYMTSYDWLIIVLFSIIGK